jgi:hypothetical protein
MTEAFDRTREDIVARRNLLTDRAMIAWARDHDGEEAGRGTQIPMPAIVPIEEPEREARFPHAARSMSSAHRFWTRVSPSFRGL